MQAPRLQARHKRRPARLRLDDPIEADLLVARIQDHVGIRLLQPPLGKAAEQAIQALVDPADRAR